MGILESLFGGGGGDPYDMYGDLFTDKQKAALRDREMGSGLLRMAGAFAKAAEPTLMPGGGIGSAIGKAAAAMGEGGDESMNQALKGMQTAEAVRASQQKRALQSRISPILLRIIEQQNGLPSGSLAPAAAAAPATPAAPDASPASPSPAAAPDPGGGVPMRFGLGAPQDRSQYGFPARPAAAPPRGTGWPAFTPPEWAPDAPGAGEDASPSAPDRVDGGLRYAPGGSGWKPPVPPIGNGPQTGLLAPPDELVAQTAPEEGLLARMQRVAAMQQGGGGGSGLPFQLASAAAIPGAGGDEVGSGGGDPARMEADLALVRKYESGNRNIMQNVVGPEGGYNPSVGRVTGPSSAGGYYQMIDSTWRSAAGKAGIDTEKYPRAIDAPPEAQHAAAQALYQDRGLADWAPYNRTLARAVGWQGPSASGEGSGGGAAPGGAAPAPGGGAAPSGGTIPGLGMTPQGLAALNALTEMGGLGEPFKSLLETYYKSPGYLGEAARSEATARRGVDLELGPQIKEAETRAQLKVERELKPALEAAIETAKNDPRLAYEEKKAVIDRLTKQLEQIGTAQSTPVEATVLGTDGRQTTQKMTMLEFMQRREAGAKRSTPQPGDIVGAPVFTETEKAIGTNAAKAFGEQRDAAQAAAQQIKINNESLRLLDTGLYTGWDANLALGFSRVFNVGGKNDKEKIQNTQLFILQRMQDAAAAVRAQPGSASDKDVQFAQRMAIGDITLEPGTIREGLEIYNRYNLDKIREHNRNAAQIRPDVTAGIRQTIDEPPAYERRRGNTPGGNTWTRPPGQ